MKKLLIIAFVLRLALAGTVLAQGSNPLHITCPPNRTHWVCGSSFAFVNYTAPTTTGSCTGGATVTCTPPSGALFTLGTTIVTCQATNSCRESATCSFTVTVRASLLYNGLCHSPLGLAALNVNSNDELEVSGFGTNGQDGVRIELGESKGLVWRMENPPGTPEGDMEIEVFGRTAQGIEAPVRRVTHHYRNGRTSVTPAAGPYQFKLLLRGQVVFQQGGRTGDVDIPECHHVEQEHCVGEAFEGLNPNLPYCLNVLTVECEWDTPAGPVRADTLVLTPEDPLPSLAAVTAVQIRGRNIRDLPVLTLLKERVLKLDGPALRLLSEIEPNNALASAQDLGLVSCVSVVGRTTPAGDVDYYRFTAGPNSKAWITVDTGGAAWLGANTRDSVLTLHNGAGAVIESDDNDGSGNGEDSVLESGDASAIAGAALAGGTYYLSVQAAVAGQIIAPYRLYLTVTTNDPSPEMEPNATAATATTLIAPGLTHGVRNASLGPAGDADWYTVSVPGPGLLHVSVDGDPERDGTGTDTEVELFRQDAVSVLFSANSSSAGAAVAEGFVYRLSIPGTYYLRVRAGGTAAINGTYRVMAAHCPLPPLPPLGIALRRGGLLLSWPAALEPCLFRSSRDLRQWSFLDVTPMADGDQLRVELPSSFPQQFFQLVPAGGWSNDSYHCCDANGTHCNTVAPNPHLNEQCDRIVFRCYETENSSECEVWHSFE